MGKKENIFPKVMQSIHERILALSGKNHSNVLFISTAAIDSEDRIKDFTKYYSGLGAKVDVLRLIKEHPDKAGVKSKIESADIIYVTGGSTFRMIKTWKKYGVDDLLKQAYRHDTVLAGHSAGAICWFSYGNCDSFSKEKIFRVTAMGIFNALLCPHYDSEPHRQPALKKMMKRTYGMFAIALDEYAGIEIIDDKYKIIVAKPDAKARRIYWRNGKYIVEEIEPDKFKKRDF